MNYFIRSVISARQNHLDADQIHAAFAGDRLRQHRLAGAGHSVQQDAALQLYRGVPEDLRILERPLQNFRERTLHVRQPADVGPRVTAALVQLHILHGNRYEIRQRGIHVLFCHDHS